MSVHSYSVLTDEKIAWKKNLKENEVSLFILIQNCNTGMFMNWVRVKLKLITSHRFKG